MPHSPACQVINDVSIIAVNAHGQPLDVALTRGFSHPNLLRTLAWAYGESRSGRPICWVVMDFADQGTLEVGAGGGRHRAGR